MSISTDLIWKPLLEAAAQTIVGAIGGHAFTEAIKRATRHSNFKAPMDRWTRGLQEKVIGDGDRLIFQGVISPYSQLSGAPSRPYGLLLPRGTEGGMSCKLFLMATDNDMDHVGRQKKCGSMSFCCVGDEYLDARPMGEHKLKRNKSQKIVESSCTGFAHAAQLSI